MRSTQSREDELEEFRATVMHAAKAISGADGKSSSVGSRGTKEGDGGDGSGRIVCVTSGVSFVGFAIVNRLVERGYSVRLALETQEDVEKVREMEMFAEMGADGVWPVVANVMDLDSLCRAFDGCSGVFHTSAFVDPSGVSGYTKQMANMEARAAERVIEACVTTESVRKCVFTSSLLACIWRQNSPLNHHLPAIVDENCWSDESLCRDRKLWFALGKTMAEKAAWRAARGRNLNLTTICPALATGPGFSRRNSTSSIGYFKGAQEMFAEGMLATIDVNNVAEAHVRVYEAMTSTACGRYICFDHIIHQVEEVLQLERQLGVSNSCNATSTEHRGGFELSNRKLSRLMSASRRCSFDTYSMLY